MYFLDFINSCLLEKLTERQKRIAMWRTQDVFGLGGNEKTHSAIGEIEGLSGGRCQQITLEIIRKVKHRIQIIEERMKQPQVLIKYIEKAEDITQANLPIVYKPVDSLGEMTVRTRNCIFNSNIRTIEELINTSEYDLLRIPNFGKKGLRELKDLLDKQNLKFIGEKP